MNNTDKIITNIECEGFFHHHTVTDGKNPSRFEMHCHDFYEIYFFVRGSGHFVVAGYPQVLKPYTLILLKPHEFHCFKFDSLKEYERYVVIFSDKILNSEYKNKLLSVFNDRADGAKPVLYDLGYTALREVFERFPLCLFVSPAEKEILSSSILQELLVVINGLIRKESAAENKNSSPKFLVDILNYINENITLPLSLDLLSERFLISKYHLSRQFHTHVGVSFHEYIAKKRIFVAQSFLNKGFSANETAWLSGFKDYTTFFRTYKKVTGNSPASDKSG